MKKSALMAILCMLWGACPATVLAQEIQLQKLDGGRLECLTEEGEEEAELLMQASGVFSHTPLLFTASSAKAFYAYFA